jgi:hypothetical protein
MSEDTDDDVAITPAWVERKVKKLFELIAADTEVDDGAESILDMVFDEDDLDLLSEEYPVLHGALERVAVDYDKTVETDANLEQSQQALSAIAENMALRADADDGDDAADEDDAADAPAKGKRGP